MNKSSIRGVLGERVLRSPSVQHSVGQRIQRSHCLHHPQRDRKRHDVAASALIAVYNEVYTIGSSALRDLEYPLDACQCIHSNGKALVRNYVHRHVGLNHHL